MQGDKNYSQQISYESAIGHRDLGIFPKDVDVKKFVAHIQDLTDVAYTGTEMIQREIIKRIIAAKQKADSDRTASQNQTVAEKTQSAQPPQTNTNTKQPVSKSQDPGKLISEQSTIAEKSQSTQHPQTNINTQQQGGNASKPIANTAKSDNSFWTDKPAQQSSEPGKLIPEQPIHKTLPDFVQTTDGGYFHRGADGRFRQLTADEYAQAKKNAATPAATTKQAEAPKMSSEEVKMKVNQMFVDAQAKNDAINQKIEQTAEMWRQNFYYAEAIRNGKQNLAALSTLIGDYNSVQELEADFNQQYNAIRGEVNSLEQSRNAQLANATNNTFNGNSTEQAVGQSIQLIGGFVNSLKADKEAKAAREALVAERKRQLALLEERKKKARLDMRNKLLQTFPDGGTPLISHKITVPEVYMFAYILNKATFNDEESTVTVSNVFPVAQYSDGTYPYKTTVANKLKGFAPGDIVLIGYYTEKSRAEQMRNSFLNLAAKSELTVKSFALKSTPSSSSSAKAADGDFWETGNKASTEKKTAEKKSDFWNN